MLSRKQLMLLKVNYMDKVISFLNSTLEVLKWIYKYLGIFIGALGAMLASNCTFHADNLDICLKNPQLEQCQVK